MPCPSCGKPARRDTDTLDTFVDSSWYFARFCDTTAEKPVDRAAADYWLPVDQYIGGIEHAILHLLYARFFMRGLNKVRLHQHRRAVRGNVHARHGVPGDLSRSECGAWLRAATKSRSATARAFLKGTDVPVAIGPSEKMSKSKKNVIAPETIIDVYGADTIRWFMLSDTPPERDIDWTDAGAEACWRFWPAHYRLVDGSGEICRCRAHRSERPTGAALELRRATHRAIAAVTEDLEALRFNRAVARIYELANAIAAADAGVPGAVRREALETLVLLTGPMMPHLAETCWNALGHSDLVVDTPWPKADPALVHSDMVTIAVQVNGKRRGEITISRTAEQKSVEAAALALDGVVRALDGKPPRRVIVVPERIVNVVA